MIERRGTSAIIFWRTSADSGEQLSVYEVFKVPSDQIDRFCRVSGHASVPLGGSSQIHRSG